MNGTDFPQDFYKKPPKSKAYKMIGQFFKPLLEHFYNDVLKARQDIKIEVNPETFIDIFLRYDERILYFYIFHQGMEPNQHKRLALLVFWIVKLKPLKIRVLSNGYSKETSHLESTINESFGVYMVRAFLESFYKGLKLPETYLEELQYSLRYRDLSKESLYLCIDQFYHFMK